MKAKPFSITRRSFFKTAGVAGLGAALSPLVDRTSAKAATPATAAETSGMPTRPFGRSGIQVPILSLGGMFDIPANQTLLKQALRWGVTYWDTAHIYSGGRSEAGIGQFFERYPETRKQIFLVTKSGGDTPDALEQDLLTSLERMRTDHVDLFFVHGIRDAGILDNRLRAWSDAQKAAGRIRLFGFSTHSNMEQCLLEAARMGWIDGIMMTYNFRLMHSPRMQEAVQACVEAGIGLTAMKTQGGGAVRTDGAEELALAGRFVQKGFTDKQAKLKAVWESPQIAAICSQMPTMSILMANIAAAVDRTTLSENDRRHLESYAQTTYAGYCAGCTHICEKTLGGGIPVGDVMRFLMYARSYGDTTGARQQFAALSESVRQKLPRMDYTLAESRCPRRLPIARLMREAIDELA